MDPFTIAFVLTILSGITFSKVDRKIPPDQLNAITVSIERVTEPVAKIATPAELIVLSFNKENIFISLKPYSYQIINY